MISRGHPHPEVSGMTVDIREVEGFDKIRFRGPGILKITSGRKDRLAIHAPGYVMNDIESTVTHSTLHLGYVSPRVVSLKINQEIISYELHIKELRHITVVGSGRTVIPDLDNDVLGVTLSGSGQVVLDHLTADRFDAEISGSGSVRVAGDVESQAVDISGSGRYEAEALVSDYGRIRMTGSGTASVAVNEDLNVFISGSGNVVYSGFPEVFKQISGSGKLTRKRRQKKQKTRQGEGYE